MAYITLANASSIIFKSEIKNLDLQGELYKKKIYFYSKFEKNALLAIKELLENPEAYFTDVYEAFEPLDTYTLVYEGRRPAYHNQLDCPSLSSDYENFEIPEEIREEGKTKVIEFRMWFESVRHLLEDRPDAFVARLQARWGIHTNVNAISRGNSGFLEMENITIEDLECRIDERIKSAARFYYKSEMTQAVLRRLSQYTFLAYKDEPISINHTGYDDETTKMLLKYYDKEFKLPLKKDLIEYYRLTLNPEVEMQGTYLKNLGFKPCGHCHPHQVTNLNSHSFQASI
ncbi:MAG: hypothetical protein ACTSU7_11185 [Candidatus Heimdallarchaeaceae archaeon]